MVNLELGLCALKRRRSQFFSEKNKRDRITKCRALLLRFAADRHCKIRFFNKKYFELEMVFNVQNGHIYAPSFADIPEQLRQLPRKQHPWFGWGNSLTPNFRRFLWKRGSKSVPITTYRKFWCLSQKEFHCATFATRTGGSRTTTRPRPQPEPPRPRITLISRFYQPAGMACQLTRFESVGLFREFLR